MASLIKKCAWCGNSYLATKSNQVFCSRKCQSSNKRASKIMTKKCTICGEKFTTTYKHKCTCSKECSKRNTLNHMSKTKIFWGKLKEDTSIVDYKYTPKINKTQPIKTVKPATSPTNNIYNDYKCIKCSKYATWRKNGICVICQNKQTTNNKH